MRLILLAIAAAAVTALASCSAPSSNALRTGQGIPAWSYPSGSYSPAPSAPC